MAEAELAGVGGCGGGMGEEEHGRELGMGFAVQGERDGLLDGMAFLDALDGVADARGGLDDHDGDGHSAEVDEVVAFVVHALDDLRDLLVVLADFSKLQEVEQAHHRDRESHRGRDVGLEVLELLGDGEENVRLPSVCIVFHDLRDDFTGLVDRGHSPGHDVEHTEDEAEERVVAEREQPVIIGRKPIDVLLGVPVVLRVVRDFAALGIGKFFHFLRRVLLIEPVPDVVGELAAFQAFRGLLRHADQQNVNGSSKQARSGADRDVVLIHVMQLVEFRVQHADLLAVLPKFFLREDGFQRMAGAYGLLRLGAQRLPGRHCDDFLQVIRGFLLRKIRHFRIA